VAVKVGDEVKAGQVLAMLDPTDLQRSLYEAQLRLANDEIAANTGELSRSVQEAQLRLSNDQIALNKTIAPVNAETDLENARAAVRQAQANLEAAERDVEIVRWSPEVFQAPIERRNEYNYYLSVHGKLAAEGYPPEELQNEWTNVLIARGKLEQAERNARDAVANSENAVRKAQEDLAKAQATLADLENGPDANAVQQAQNAVAMSSLGLQDAQQSLSQSAQRGQNTVELSRLAVERAEQALANATLRAPFDGKVGAVGIKVGDRVGGGTGGSGANATTIDIVSDQLQVQAQVDESQIASVKVGQPAQVSVDAIAQTQQRPLNGKVASVSPLGTTTQGVVNYAVTVEVTEGARAGLLPGMTAQANIVLAQANNVLAVPNRAVRRSAGGASVQVLENGAPKETSVQVGLSDDRYTEVIGLAEGTLVVMPSSTGASSTTNAAPQGIRTGPGAAIGGAGTFAVPAR
jgi:HlyD family secretion protein